MVEKNEHYTQSSFVESNEEKDSDISKKMRLYSPEENTNNDQLSVDLPQPTEENSNKHLSSEKETLIECRTDDQCTEAEKTFTVATHVERSIVEAEEASITEPSIELEEPRIITIKISWQVVIMKYEQRYRNHYPAG